MESIRFRDSWFIRVGLAIVAISVVSLIVLGVVGLIAGKEIEAGLIGVLFLAGVPIGLCYVVLGAVGVLIRRRESCR